VAASRLKAKYTPLLAPAIMAMAMSLLMSLVQTIVRLGSTPNLVPAWLTFFVIGVIVAVPTAVLVGPHAQRLASHLTGAPHQPAQDDGCLDH
jgi:integral membrane sensor domain MASE1